MYSQPKRVLVVLADDEFYSRAVEALGVEVMRVDAVWIRGLGVGGTAAVRVVGEAVGLYSRSESITALRLRTCKVLLGVSSLKWSGIKQCQRIVLTGALAVQPP